MNHKSYFRALLAAAIACGAAACDENSWNDKLDGFDAIEDQPTTQVQTIEYTLTADNYSKIAANSTNVALAGEEGAAALAAVGSKKCFTPEAPASKYVPAFLGSADFPYFTLTQGSAVKLTYNQTAATDEIVAEATDAQNFTVPGSFYVDYVWESDDNYVNAFAPSKPAADYLPEFLLDEGDANDGTYAVVNYKLATQEPVFGGATQPSGPIEIFAQSFTEDLGAFTIDNKLMPADLTYVWSWGGANYGAKASAFSNGTSYATESWLISPEIDLSGVTSAVMNFEHVVNKFPDAEFARANCTLWGRKSGSTSWTQIIIPEYTDNTSWTFGPSGDVNLDAFAGSKMQFAFKYVSEDGKSGTWEVKNLTVTGVMGANAPAMRAAANVPVVDRTAIYHYENDKWVVPANFVVLQPADYTEMGQSHPNLSTNEPFLSIYLSRNFPYAAEDDYKYVVWMHYAGGSSSYDCTKYVFNGTEWVAQTNVEAVTEQFVCTSNGWVYSPDVTINLPAGKNQPVSSLYYQACVDWVFENICVPLGDTNIKSGLFYVSSYGNNEYYSGTSAYQGNVDLRASAARAQYGAEYDPMTDEEIIALEKSRFMNEVMPGALATLHADAKPVEGADVHYIINFYYYTGSATLPATATFRVSGPGQFEPVECTWDE